MLNTYEQHSKRKLATIVLSIIVIAGVVVLADRMKSADSTAASTLTPSSPSSAAPDTPINPDTSSQPVTTAPSTNSSGSSSSSGTYKDGAYSAASTYYVPPGRETIDVNVTLSSGTITNVSIQNSEDDRTSALYQRDFASEYKSYVVGKKISGLHLTNIAGASDTTDGFNEALSQIASKAQA